MISPNEAFVTAVEAAVARIEKTTDAEIVVVTASKSGVYRDVSLIGAAIASLLLLALIIVAPVDLHPLGVLIELAVAFPVFTWMLGHPAFTRRATSQARQEAQVQTAAAAEFLQEAIHGTPNRTGVLIYISLLEHRVVILGDFGVDALVPRGEWSAATEHWKFDDTAGFCRYLETFGELLAKRVPANDTSDHFDLPNAPRIRQ